MIIPTAHRAGKFWCIIDSLRSELEHTLHQVVLLMQGTEMETSSHSGLHLQSRSPIHELAHADSRAAQKEYDIEHLLGFGNSSQRHHTLHHLT